MIFKKVLRNAGYMPWTRSYIIGNFSELMTPSTNDLLKDEPNDMVVMHSPEAEIAILKAKLAEAERVAEAAEPLIPHLII